MAEVIIAKSFFSATSKLQAKDKAAAMDFITQFQENPANPGVSLERIVKAKSAQVWSGRITQDLRAILHKDGNTWVILYADRHDPAYEWASRRTIGRHPVTGSFQVIETVEEIKRVEKIVEVRTAPDSRPLFESHDDAYLVSLGVPKDWLPTLRKIRDEDQLLEVCTELPEDVVDRLFMVAEGKLVTPPKPVPPELPVGKSPDLQGRFYLVQDEVELRAALEAPMEQWIGFLHQSQREMVVKEFNGPVKVTGSAGTGKTVVAMHRARHLARQGHRVLLTSFVTTLCNNIQRSLELFCTADDLERISVSTVHSVALELVRSGGVSVSPTTDEKIRKQLIEVARRISTSFDMGFLQAEWENVVQNQGLVDWSEYRSARRTGRGRPLAAKDRKVIWGVFEALRDALAAKGLADWAWICRKAEALLESGEAERPYTAVLVDESQDLKAPDIRLLRALSSDNPENLMLVGDAGQRIYPGGFSLSALGLEVRGRSRILRINYRTTEQIRKRADRLLGETVDNFSGGTETRKGTRSLLAGPEPVFTGYARHDAELGGAVEAVQNWLAEGLQPKAIGLFARTKKRRDQLADALGGAGIGVTLLSGNEGLADSKVNVGTMHRAKGLEFKSVLVFDCSASALPSPGLLRLCKDPQDREDAVEREKRLLYVAMTRARDSLNVTWAGEPSPFLDDLVDSN